MYAVVEIAGKQYKIGKNDRLAVPSIDKKPGDKVAIDRVLLVGDEKSTTVGKPTVSGVTIEAKVVDHGKADKVIVFKKKRRKGYRVKRGHKQGLTEIEITSISR